MELRIVCIGKMKRGPEYELADKFISRIAKIGPDLHLAPLKIIEINESQARRATDRQRDEAEKIKGQLDSGLAQTICLDERGKNINSREFSGLLRLAQDDGYKHLNFIIGGPDGLDKTLITESFKSISFSPLTWPHQMVRIMLLEQIYRGMTILANHPYHRD